jgi:uncharacterized protein (TIGR02118 family)
MVRVTAFYAHSDDAQFDWDYYLNKHLPLVRELVGEKLLRMNVDRGLHGVAAGLPPMFIAITQLDFESAEVLQELMLTAVPKIVADIPNYTSVALQIQVSEVVA